MARLKIYIDENVDIRIAIGLRKRGIEAFSAIEEGTIGTADLEHFNHAATKQAVIFTHDHHFVEIAGTFLKKGKDFWGVIFTEMHKLSMGECIKRLALYADILSAEEMKNQIEFL
ncbi:MAG: DUF5615 family PIN-like protein [Candidatus Schekmanbacteria bacterium]|nr:DUF5615 family PIN-like protein [Candidatus Schekmanbacteria bacterium]